MRRGKQNTLSAHTTVLDRRDSPCSGGCVAMCILRCVASRRQLPLPPAGSFQFFSSPLLCSSLKMLIPLTAAAVLPLSYRARAPRANCYECFGCVCVCVCVCACARVGDSDCGGLFFLSFPYYYYFFLFFHSVSLE